MKNVFSTAVLCRASCLALLLVLSACTSTPPPPMVSVTELPPLHEGGAYDNTRLAGPPSVELASSPRPASTPPPAAPTVPATPASATPAAPLAPVEQAALTDLQADLERAVQSPNPAEAIRQAATAALRRAPRQLSAITAKVNEVAQRAGLTAAQAQVAVNAAMQTAGPQMATVTVTPPAGAAGGGGGGGGPGLLALFQRDYVMVQVLYATDRKPVMPLNQWRQELPEKGSDHVYFGDQHGELQYGHCTVSVPAKVHKEGQVERPEWYRKESVLYDITLRGLIPLSKEQMTERIAGLAASSPEKDALVVIHGYNVRFNDAIMTTAQIAYDFKFTGAPILYSWPSAGKLRGYGKDGELVAAAEDSLHAFLNEIVLKAGAKKIHLLAHSMGNRLLVNVLKRLEGERPGQTIFDEIVLAAPDVAQEDFRADVAKSLAALAHRVSLYVSSRDRALTASHLVNGKARLGESGKDLYLVRGVDTIDASAVETDLLNHSYYAQAAAVIGDIVALLKSGVPPGEAPRNLPVDTTRGLPFWRFGGAR